MDITISVNAVLVAFYKLEQDGFVHLRLLRLEFCAIRLQGILHFEFPFDHTFLIFRVEAFV